MAERAVVLTDVDHGLYHESFEIGPESGIGFAGSSRWRIAKRRLHGGKSDGVDVVEIDNGELRVEVLPTRGMGLWRAEYRGIPLAWESPVRRPVHPEFVDHTLRNGIGWLEGFQELLCRCGLAWFGPPCDDGGEPLTLHGRIANTPAHFVAIELDDAADTLAVRGAVDESSLFGPALRLESTLSTSAGSNRLVVADVVTNLSDQPAEMQLLYHLNVGQPFLGDGTELVVAAETVAPRDQRAAEGVASWNEYGPPRPGFAEQAYYVIPRADESGRSSMLLQNTAADLGLQLDVQTDTLPCFTMWKNTAGEADGYVTGLEPGTGFPNARPFERERGRVVVLGPGESRAFSFAISVHDTAEAVSQALRTISEIDGGRSLEVHSEPQAEYSPV